MTRTVLMCACLSAALAAGSGCRTASGHGRSPDRLTNAPALSTPAAQEDSRSLEQRAEADARFMAGFSHELNDARDEALENFTRAAEADPGNEVLVLDLSARFIFMKRYDKALAILNKALEQPRASALLDSRLAFVHMQMGSTNAALRASQNAVRKAPRAILGYQSLFQIHLQSGQTNEANRILEQASRVPKPDAEFLVDLSEMYFLQSRANPALRDQARSRALEALNRAASLEPTNFFVLQKLADGFTQTGDRKQATAVLVKIQKLYPDLPTIRERLVNLYLRDQDKKNAAEQLEGLIRENPTDPQAYYLLGIIAFDDHRFDDAADCFQKAILLKPELESAYYELAISFVNLDKSNEALETLSKARKKFNDTFLTEYCTALAYQRQKDYTNALRHLTVAEVIASATETNRLTHVFYFQLGSANERVGRWTEAVDNLKRCLKLAPDFAEALNYLGYMWAEKGTNLVEARQMIEKALKQEPDNAAFIDSLAWVLFKLGHPGEALSHMQRAIQLSKEGDAVLYDHLGDILAALNQTEQAREAWRKALGLEPSPELRKKLGLPAP